MRSVSLMVGGALAERQATRHAVGGFSLTGGRRLVTGSGTQPSESRQFLFLCYLLLKHNARGVYGYQRDESLQCVLPAPLCSHGSACGVSPVCWESERTQR